MKKNKILTLLIISIICFSLGILGIGCSSDAPQENNEIKDVVVTLNDNDLVLEEGSTFALVVSGTDKAYSFSSVDESIATVSTEGTITAVGMGKTFILVSIPELNKTINCAVEVTEDGYQVYLNLGESTSVTLNSKVEVVAQAYKNGALVNKNVEWTFDGTCAQVESTNNKAVLSANSVGKGTIKAKLNSAVASCEISVYPENVTALSTPVVTMKACDMIMWAPVENADAYMVKAGNKAWERVTETNYDLLEQADLLSDFTVCIKAVNDAMLYVDSEIAYEEFSHEFGEGEYLLAQATCKDETSLVYECKNCDRQKIEENVYGPHNYQDGYCSSCKQYYSPGLKFTYFDDFGGFIVTDAKTISQSKVLIPSTYTDAEHGTKPVVAIGNNSFQSNALIEEVIVPNSVKYMGHYAFWGCSSLKKVVMEGVTRIYLAELGPNKELVNAVFIDSQETRSDLRTFYNCVSLETVVVNPDLILGGDEFAFEASKYPDYDYRLKLYVNSAEQKPLTIFGKNGTNNMIGGGRALSFYCFRKADLCGFWDYIDGEPVFFPHTYKDGVCSCGITDPEGLSYEYVEYKDFTGYQVQDNGYKGEVVRIKSHFNDGVNGLHEVVLLKNFLKNTNIKKVIVPDTVKYLGLMAFNNCTSLEEVHIPGVTHLFVLTDGDSDLLTLDSTRRNFSSFYNCINLKKVVLNPNFIIGGNEFCYDKEKYPDYKPELKLYIDSSEIRPLVCHGTGTTNYMINGGQDLSYYYFRKPNTPGYWDYVDGEPTYMPTQSND